MQPAPHVLVQISLLIVVYGVVLIGRGDAVALPSLVAAALGAVIALGFALAYHSRRRARLRGGFAISVERLRQDRQMAFLCLFGYGVPLAVGVATLLGLHFDGALFNSRAATVGSVLPVLAFVAVVTSSAVDWYLIRPFQCGVLNEPLCRRGADAPDEVQRRAFAKWWLTHRGLCELIAYASAAFMVAIIVAAVTEATDADDVLKIAIGSFIGASTAVSLFSYLMPRIISCWEYMQIQSAGLGMWSNGRDAKGTEIHGFVRDVSVKPGIQLCPDPDSALFVPLSDAGTAQHRADPAPQLCPGKCRRWVERCDVHLREREAAATAPPAAGS